jgi:hypothetical protein
MEVLLAVFTLVVLVVLDPAKPLTSEEAKISGREQG